MKEALQKIDQEIAKRRQEIVTLEQARALLTPEAAAPSQPMLFEPEEGLREVKQARPVDRRQKLWRNDEMALLREMWEGRSRNLTIYATDKKIAAALKRSVAGVRSMRNTLGLRAKSEKRKSNLEKVA